MHSDKWLRLDSNANNAPVIARMWEMRSTIMLNVDDGVVGVDDDGDDVGDDDCDVDEWLAVL